MIQKPSSKTLPLSPGVYLYKDATERVIYVGKAKNLRNRILSYFREQGISPKTQAMLNHAATLETVSTTTENEAFLLEASLIKKYKPRYNIVLRDDKDYVFFRLNTTEPYPRLEIIRRFRPGQKNAGILVFGPFSSAGAARETWKVIYRAFPLRRCSSKAFTNRVRPCLYHHMGQCLAPCVLNVPRETYAGLIHQTALFLSGRSDELLEAIRAEMLAASDHLDFEYAAILRDRAKAVERTVEQQSVVLSRDQDIDVLGISACDTPAQGLALGVVFIRQGMLLDKRAFFWPGLHLDDAPELIESFLMQFYQSGLPVPPRIVAPWITEDATELAGTLPEEIHSEPLETSAQMQMEQQADKRVVLLETLLASIRGGPVRITHPQNPAEDRLVSLAATNATDAVRTEDHNPLSTRLATKLHATTPIERIEAVDVSHTGGSNTRVGMVVFEHGRPLRSAYRSYAVDAEGDDYAALRLWATRRAAAGPPWPDLLLIDGGRGQLATVVRAFEDAGAGTPFTLAGIAKARTEDGRADRRAGNTEDRIFLPGRSNPLPLNPGSTELIFLQHVRDTVHDYALGRHRVARTNEAFAGELLRIPGVGPKIAKLLWQAFGSLQDMASANEEQLAAIPGIGVHRARLLSQRLRGLVNK